MTWRTWLLIHAIGTVATTVWVIHRNHRVEAYGQPATYALSMVALAAGVWPLMLLAECYRTIWPRPDERTKDLGHERQGIRGWRPR